MQSPLPPAAAPPAAGAPLLPPHPPLPLEAQVRQLAGLLRVDASLLVGAAARLVAVWLLAWVAWRAVRLAAHRIELAVDDGDPTTDTREEKRGRTIAQLVRSVGRLLVLVLAVLLSLDVFFDIGPLLAGAGILGLAVSFGAQSLVKDVISGFFMLMEGQLHMGDTVELAGKSGTVERMTLRVVALRDLDGTLHYVPNSEIRTVSNRTAGWSRVVLDVGVPYAEDIDRAAAVLRDEAGRFAAEPEWAPRLLEAPELLGVQALADSAVVLRLWVRTTPGAQFEVARELRRRLKRRLDAEGIAIPFPQREVQVTVRGAGAEGVEGAAAAAAAGAAGA
ncbi:MAG: mechanosensitive ion channel family protein [Gemmatimonadales bacterium]|nr:mechanosensitive ion channel family protein [Gemmatimonadales bacterium]